MNPLVRIELYGSVRQRKRIRKKREKQKAGRAKRKTLNKINQFKVELKERATSAEKYFEQILIEGGFKYEFQKELKTGDGYKIVDFYLSDYDVVIEIDGEYHETPEQKKCDQNRTRALLKTGRTKKVFRFSNREILGNIPSEILKRLIIAICPEASIAFILD